MISMRTKKYFGYKIDCFFQRCTYVTMKMKERPTKIIKGYHGVMDLDLTHVDPNLHDVLIKEHKKDIELYKIEQDNLPPNKRYENNVGYVKKKLELENHMRATHDGNESNQQERRKKMEELYNIVENR